MYGDGSDLVETDLDPPQAIPRQTPISDPNECVSLSLIPTLDSFNTPDSSTYSEMSYEIM